ncbi:MAG: LLM class F420-dependent oxidoreductase [Candidatus Binatia bacterium]
MAQIGTFVPQGWRLEMRGLEGGTEQWSTAKAVAQRLEDLGYDSLWLYDHFHTVPRAEVQPTLECWTTMAALAEATSQIRLGQLVTCSLYRNPAYLAKISACVDVISGGRVDVGIGAGWKEEEFDAYGYQFPSIRERLDRMADTARILKAMWTEERATVTGKHYSVENAINEPKPLQKPHPPIWIGTQGEKVGLRMVAELADGWNHNRGTEEFERKLAALRAHCENVGRDPSTVRVSAERTCAVFSDDAERLAYIERYWPGAPPERVSKFLDEQCVGTAEQVAEQLRFFVDHGAELIILWFQDLADLGSACWQPERFMREVAPKLR